LKLYSFEPLGPGLRAVAQVRVCFDFYVWKG